MNQACTLPSLADCAPPLRAKLAPWMERVLESRGKLETFLQEYGSPLHLLVDSEFARNAQSLLSAYSECSVDGRMYFARKANKLPWFVSAAIRQGLGVDVASLNELVETMNLGASPEKIIVTAVGKSERLIGEALLKGCLIVIDNHEELNVIKNEAQRLGIVARIGLRFSGFEFGGRPIYSRFGLAISEHKSILKDVLDAGCLKLEILHAHLDKYDTEERAVALKLLAQIAADANDNGANIRSIDLGGGILIRYLNDEKEWDTFQHELYASVMGSRPSFTFRGDGLGYAKVGDNVIGVPDLYPAHNHLSKERFLKAVLLTGTEGKTAQEILQNAELQVDFEPGRALLDNCGLTIARVAFTKTDSENNLLVGLEMNRTNLRPFRAEFICDPIFLLKNDKSESTAQGAFLVGNLCSESDFIYRRRLAFSQIPKRGDICVFPNTAGYLAHHMEIGTHGGPLPKNVLLDENSLEVRDVV